MTMLVVLQVAQAFVDLEINSEDLRPFLKNLHIAGYTRCDDDASRVD